MLCECCVKWRIKLESFSNEIDGKNQIFEQLETQINKQLEELSQNIHEQFAHLSERLNEAGLSSDETQKILDQAFKVGERATKRSEEKIHRSQEILERKIENAIRRSQKRDSFKDRRTFRRAQSPKINEASDSISEDERLFILRMLEEKKITIEQAEELLSALENGEA